MAKTITILRKLPDGFLETEFDDGTNKIVLSVAPPPKITGSPSDYGESEVLDYLAGQWPHPAFEAKEMHADAAVSGLMLKRKNVTTRVAAADARRRNGE